MENSIHVREYGGMLEIPERKALHWLANRMPAWVNPDHLTLLGLAAMFVAGAAFWASRWNPWTLVLVALALGVNWFGDSLDGTLARVRCCQRPRYGYYVDHVVDLVGTAALLGGMAVSGYMSPMIALGLLAVFVLVEAEVFLATHALSVFRLSRFRIGPTELRIVLAAGTLTLLFKPEVGIGGAGPFRLFDIGGAAAIVGLTAAFLVAAVRNGLELYRAEPIEPVETMKSGADA